MERRELERQIVEKEWLMFQQVQGVNGRAACQDDWTTFLIMRLSQFEGWDTDVLESYFEDIVQALFSFHLYHKYKLYCFLFS